MCQSRAAGLGTTLETYSSFPLQVLSCLKGGKTSIAASEQQTEQLVTTKTDGSETPDVCGECDDY